MQVWKSLWIQGLFARKKKWTKRKNKNRPMEKWKTQEAAFPTFPQGPPPRRKRWRRRSESKKEGGYAASILKPFRVS
jgi:hypothetical protein